jgi:hypothetical protein
LSVVADDVEVTSSSARIPSLATALFTRAMTQASPCFLVRRVRDRLSPPRVAFSVLQSLHVFNLLGLRTIQYYHLPCFGFGDPLVLLVPLPFSLSVFMLCVLCFIFR